MECLGENVLAGDGQLFLLRVAGQGDDLQPVAQRARNILQMVGRADEQHPGQIKGHVQVVVTEVDVLFGIESLKQRGGGIPSEIIAELVDLVENDDGFFVPACFMA